jgi:glycosyltransferase involved in cell wall biosynthesis
MNILLFHPSFLPPENYGGTERVVLWLARGLKKQGHRVWIAALKGSKLPEGIEILEMTPPRLSFSDLKERIPKEVEIIHFHAPLAEKDWSSLPLPSILTIHGNGKPGEKFPRNSVFLSKDHARRHGASVFIYNGIDPEEYRYNSGQRGESLLFLSKTSWSVKNLSGAMRIARRAGVPLKIAGGNRPWVKRFEAWVRPGFEWVGPVANEKKSILLSDARALIFPVIWPEPFGLVVAEALMSGTPVLGTPFGSLPELITPEVGAILKSAEEWEEVLRDPKFTWKPQDCYERAVHFFHFMKMASSYENLYQTVLKGDTLHQNTPQAKEGSIR